MTHVKFSRRPVAGFHTVVDELLSDLPGIFKNDFRVTNRTRSVPVNITELEKAFRIEVFAPGFEKSDLSIQVEEDLLTVSGERKEGDKNPEGEKTIRREYELGGFKRSFTLSETIDATRIEASFINGVLILNLPKKEAVKGSAKEIQIS